jgi:hypothetical protein
MTADITKDSQADAAILFRQGELNDNGPDGTNLKVYIRIKIFTELGRRYSDVQLPYKQELGKITDVRARTIRPDGSIVEVADRDIRDIVLLRNSRSIWRAKVFLMPAVEAGSIIEYRYRQTYPQGFRYFALDLQSELFTRELYYRIQPKTMSRMDVRWVSFNADDPKLFMPTWDGTYNIKATDIQPFRREPLAPPELTMKIWGWLYYSDETETRPDRYWRGYARRMHERASYETKPTGPIRRVVDSITLSTDGPKEKLGRIYSYVQKEIRNVGFRAEGKAEGEEGAKLKRNNSAEDTIRRRYGTPREINRLFIAMLRAAGFDARVAELTTRDENFFHHSFPDSYQFNDELTAVVGRDGSVQFYDPGTPYCPVGLLSWEKQAVQALVYGKQDWSFKETPLTKAPDNNQHRAITVTPFADGHVDLLVETKISGQRALELRNELNNLSAEQRRAKIIEDARGLMAAAVIDESSVALTGLTDLSAPLGTAYRLRAEQVASPTERRLLLRPALLSRREETMLSASSRSNSIYFAYPWSETERVAIEVPRGYAVVQLPDPVVLDIGAARYCAAFTLDGQRVIYERSLSVDALMFTVAEYPTVKGFFDRVHQADQAVVSFKQ